MRRHAAVIVHKPWTASTGGGCAENKIYVPMMFKRSRQDGVMQTIGARRLAPQRTEKSLGMIAKASKDDCKTAFITQSKRCVSQHMEYVNRCFCWDDDAGDDDAVTEAPVVALCSMMLRSDTANKNPVNVAEEIHKDFSSCGTAVIVVVYCCWPRDAIDVRKLPQRTIIVSFETMQTIMHPFGATAFLGC